MECIKGFNHEESQQLAHAVSIIFYFTKKEVEGTFLKWIKKAGHETFIERIAYANATLNKYDPDDDQIAEILERYVV